MHSGTTVSVSVCRDSDGLPTTGFIIQRQADGRSITGIKLGNRNKVGNVFHCVPDLTSGTIRPIGFS